jgi:hypothetical protein
MAQLFPSKNANSALPSGALHHAWRDALERLLDCLGQRLPLNRAVEAARRRLESLPLASAEFALARLRLSNIEAYGSAGEWGAAAFELRRLQDIHQAAPAKPKIRQVLA